MSKKFKSELAHNYETYSFGYADYCIYEENDDLKTLYDEGYLPYTGSHNPHKIFYMARTARVPLQSWEMSSENRRIAKKFDGQLTREKSSIKEVDTGNKDLLNFCLHYFSSRHQQGIMPKERLRYILEFGIIKTVVTYFSTNKTPVAYIFEVSDDSTFTHFWFSFYTVNEHYKSLGMWLVLDSAREAKKDGREFFYLGTVYGEKALYKTAFRNIEFWNGTAWIKDLGELKQLVKNDNLRSITHSDQWKGTQNPF